MTTKDEIDFSQYVSLSEAATLYGVSINTVKSWRQRRALWPVFRLKENNRQIYFYRRSDVEALIAEDENSVDWLPDNGMMPHHYADEFPEETNHEEY